MTTSPLVLIIISPPFPSLSQDLQTKLLKSENLVENLQHELASRNRTLNTPSTRILSAPSPRGTTASSIIGSSSSSSSLSIIVPPSRPKSNYEKSPLKSISKLSHHGPSGTNSTPSRHHSAPPYSPAIRGSYGQGTTNTTLSHGHGSSSSDLIKFTSTIDHMDKQLSELKYLFRPMNPLHERYYSIIKIQSRIRQWIIQKKYQKYWTSLSSWCHHRSQTFLPLIDYGLYRSSRINSTILAIQIKKNNILLKLIFDRWIHICKQSAPFRRSMIVAAEEKYRAKIFKFKLEVTN
jgi:hypothetical protein